MRYSWKTVPNSCSINMLEVGWVNTHWANLLREITFQLSSIQTDREWSGICFSLEPNGADPDSVAWTSKSWVFMRPQIVVVGIMIIASISSLLSLGSIRFSISGFIRSVIADVIAGKLLGNTSPFEDQVVHVCTVCSRHMHSCSYDRRLHPFWCNDKAFQLTLVSEWVMRISREHKKQRIMSLCHWKNSSDCMHWWRK